VQHLEQEVKLEVAAGWRLPDLAGSLPGATVSALPTLDMEAIHFATGPNGRCRPARHQGEDGGGPPATAPGRTSGPRLVQVHGR
jgi:hypothetical protein